MAIRTLKVTAFLSFAVLAMAQAPAPKPETAPAQKGPSAEELAKNAFGASFAGLTKGSAEMRMVVTSPNGTKKDQTVSFRSTRTPKGLLLYKIRFESPAEMKGTSFLVREREGELPAQYIYLPAAKVVQEVAAGKATSSFFGSDFIYADLLPYPTDKKDSIELTRLLDKEVDNKKCYVLRIKIKDKASPYSRIEASIAQKEMVAVQVEFFDWQDKALKTLKVRAAKEVQGKLVPSDIEMKNVQAGSKTEIYIKNVNVNAKFKEEEFTKDALRNQ